MGIIKNYRIRKRAQDIKDSNEYDRWFASLKPASSIEIRKFPDNYICQDAVELGKDGNRAVYRYNLDKTELIKVCENYDQSFPLFLNASTNLGWWNCKVIKIR